MRQRIRFGIILTYLWIMMILLGSIVMETFLIYPNVFYDPPRSFEVALAFMQVRTPSDFFPPLGFLSWVTGAGAIAASWPPRTARYWIVASVAMIVCEGVFSMVFFWPRNTIMFVEGPAVHTTEVLRPTAHEFQSLHWGRVAFNAASAGFIFVGFLKFQRRTLPSRTNNAHEQYLKDFICTRTPNFAARRDTVRGTRCTDGTDRSAPCTTG